MLLNIQYICELIGILNNTNLCSMMIFVLDYSNINKILSKKISISTLFLFRIIYLKFG